MTTKDQTPASPTEGEPLRHRFLWLDLETTGLDPASCLILEWCAVLADDAPGGTFEPVAQYGSPVRIPDGASPELDPFVLKMHTSNGLLADCAGPEAVAIEEVDAFLAGLCAELGAKPRSIILAGSSVHFDLGFVRAHLPAFARYLSHRVFDVSTLWAADREYHDPAVGEAPSVRPDVHRAAPDILASLSNAASYLRAHYVGARPEAAPAPEGGVS